MTKAAGVAPPAIFEGDFVECPDIAQTLMVSCAGLGVQGLYSGLQTLAIKETDRVKAMKAELGKLGIVLFKVPPQMAGSSGTTFYAQEGRVDFGAGVPTFGTYHDHRMAMALAPLALRHAVGIEDPEVVGKSYPGFWDDLRTLGCEVQ